MHANSASDDLAERKAFLAAYDSYTSADEDTRQMSAGLKALMGEMHDYATRYDVDLYRSFQEVSPFTCDRPLIRPRRKAPTVLH